MPSAGTNGGRGMDVGAAVPAGRSAVAEEPAHVVVCDADAVSARRTARLLEKAGFATAISGSAAACEKAIEQARAAAAVIAVLLPDEDGLRLVRRLRQRGVDVRIVVASALWAGDRALEAGADAFLHKPFAREDLLSVVRRLLGREDA